MPSEVGWFDRLESRAPQLFIVGAALYAVLVGNRILATYVGQSFPEATVFATVATILIPLGMLGLYPSLSVQRPYLARVAAAVAVIPAIGWSIVLLGGVLEATGILTEAPGLLALTPFVAIIGGYVAYALHGITVLLADIHPRAVGVLFLVAAPVYPLFLTILSGVPVFVANGIVTLCILGVGLSLRTSEPSAGVEASTESIA